MAPARRRRRRSFSLGPQPPNGRCITPIRSYPRTATGVVISRSLPPNRCHLRLRFSQRRSSPSSSSTGVALPRSIINVHAPTPSRRSSLERAPRLTLGTESGLPARPRHVMLAPHSTCSATPRSPTAILRNPSRRHHRLLSSSKCAAVRRCPPIGKLRPCWHRPPTPCPPLCQAALRYTQNPTSLSLSPCPLFLFDLMCIEVQFSPC